MKEPETLYCSCEEPSKEELKKEWIIFHYNPCLKFYEIFSADENIYKIIKKMEKYEIFNRHKYFYAEGGGFFALCFKLEKEENGDFYESRHLVDKIIIEIFNELKHEKRKIIKEFLDNLLEQYFREEE